MSSNCLIKEHNKADNNACQLPGVGYKVCGSYSDGDTAVGKIKHKTDTRHSSGLTGS